MIRKSKQFAEEAKERVATVTFQDRLIEQLNRLRLHPSSFVAEVNKYKNGMSKLYKTRNALVEDIDKLAQMLGAKTTKPLPEFIMNKELTRAAEEHFDLMADSGLNKFYAQDEDYLAIALSHYVEGFYVCREFVTVDEIPEDVVMSLLISEGDSDKISRNSLLSKSFIYLGIGHGTIRGKPVSVLIMTDGAQPLCQKPFLQDIVEEFNKIRAYPKSYVKFFTSLSHKNQIKPEQVSSIIAFLKKTRRFGPFTVNPLLATAAESRVSQYVTSIAPRNEDDFRHFLEDFGMTYNVIGEYVGYQTSNGREFLISMLLRDVGNHNHMHRNLIFSQKLSQIGVAMYTGDDVHDSNNPVPVSVLFADHIEGLVENNNAPITVISHRRLLMRPRFTDDELLQLKNDFKLLDVNNVGYIIPQTILLFVNCTSFVDQNPFYYEALNLLNTEENNVNGVNVEEFIQGVAKVIRTYNESLEKWKREFKTYVENNKKKKGIDFETMKEVTAMLGYRVMNEDLVELLERIDDSQVIDDSKFTEMMDVVENSKRRK